ncbi:OmpP1/FadL family transporter [Paracoccus actinidiae]|uniref:OmpP1/FadL family transporter n=1 Tax=Paracoccus actinidiae TaxID=3064531 RepID=UPI0027D3093A|nr:outer membrane protein transport protein [Paracoccus sp. M09]
MKTASIGAATWLLWGTIVHAGGVERSNQFLGPLFEPGHYLEFSYGHVSPSITGTDLPLGPYPGGERTGDIASSYNSFGFAYKHQFNDAWSAAIILDQPFGADLAYPTSGSINLGGTGVVINNNDLTGIIRFAVPESGFGVHAGLRGARTDGSVTLCGASFGPVNGYRVDVDRDTAYGWLAGVSWERPDIAARVSLTYNAVIEHDFDITESGPLVDPDGPGPAPALPLLEGRSTLTVKTPKSWNLEFQTGIDPDTLVFGGVRWVDWSGFRVDPEKLLQVTGSGLVDLNDTTTFTIGVGRKFTDTWSGAASFTYEKSGNDLVSPLAPVNGQQGISLAALYTQDRIKITTGVSYMKMGNARPETGKPDTARAEMEGSHAWGVGVRVGYSF